MDRQPAARSGVAELKLSEQKQFETIRQQVRDWVTQNRAIFAERGGEMEERDGMDDGTAFYAVDCIMPHGVARIMVTMPAFHPFRFISMEALSVATGENVFNWHDDYQCVTHNAISTALRHLQEILLATKKAA